MRKHFDGVMIRSAAEMFHEVRHSKLGEVWKFASSPDHGEPNNSDWYTFGSDKSIGKPFAKNFCESIPIRLRLAEVGFGDWVRISGWRVLVKRGVSA